MIFIFATPLEANHFRIACPHAKVEICGVGAAECAAFMVELIEKMQRDQRSETLILAGIAGSYSLDEVALCEVVEVTHEQIASLPERFRKTYSSQPQTELRAVSSNSVNNSIEVDSDCPMAQIENMEGATFMAICQRAQIPHIQIRAISNRVGDPFEKWQIDPACKALACQLARLINK